MLNLEGLCPISANRWAGWMADKKRRKREGIAD